MYSVSTYSMGYHMGKKTSKAIHGQIRFFTANLLRNLKIKAPLCITKRGTQAVYMQIYLMTNLYFYRTSYRNSVACNEVWKTQA